MPFTVTPSDEVLIDGLEEATSDDLLSVKLEDKTEYLLCSSGGDYPRLLLDGSFAPRTVRKLATKAARIWVRHRSLGRDEDRFREAFNARPDRSQHLDKFVSQGLLDHVRARGSERPTQQSRYVQTSQELNIGRYLEVSFGHELWLPNSQAALTMSSSVEMPRLIFASPIVKIEPCTRWDAEVRHASRW